VILLLDSHVLVWWLAGAPAVSKDARRAIADPGNDVLVSAATVWELAIKRAIGKIELAADLAEAVEAAGFTPLAIGLADAELAAALPMHHRDPFDRMLVAQARRLDAVLVSRDPAFDRYDVERLLA
jgi:PIN domain nuclease of toxin-antitoxin system